MYKSELEKFLAIRVFVLWALLSLVDMMVFRGNWPVICGFTLGAVLCVLTLRVNAWLLVRIVKRYMAGGGKRRATAAGIAAFTFKELIFFQLYIMAYAVSPQFFFGMAAGAMLAPLAILINFLTESLRITKNHFFI